jgi:predicted transcriptional regulator
MQRHHPENKHLHPDNVFFWGRVRVCWRKMSREQQILSMLKQSKTKSFTPKQIAETLNIDANRIRKVLRRMTGKGLLSNPKRGFYRVKVTESDRESDKSDTDYITLPITRGKKRTTMDLDNATVFFLNWLKTKTGRNMGNLTDEAVLKYWGEKLRVSS